jgi:DNA polymerase III alpha subunit (gram-positive type)
MISKGYISLDTETSGLSFISAEVIQVGAIFYDKDFNRLGDMEVNINFPSNLTYAKDGELHAHCWSKESEGIHNISLATALNHGVSPDVFVKEFTKKRNELFRGILDKDISVIGANTYFDYVRMANMWEEANFGRFPVSHRLIDVNTLGMFLINIPNLQKILSHYKVEVDPAKCHAALYDCELHFSAFKALFDEFGSNKVTNVF